MMHPPDTMESVAVPRRPSSSNTTSAKRSVGASKMHIAVEFLLESVILSVLGWIAGLIGVYVFTALLAGQLQTYGTLLFDVTGRLILWSFIWCIILGCISGLYPALKAARLNPVEALK